MIEYVAASGIGSATVVGVQRGTIDRGDPAAPVGGLADQDAWHDQSGGRPGQEGQRAERDRPVRAAHVVVVFDRREEPDGFVDRHSRGDTAPGEPDTVADEQIAVTSGDVVEVEFDVERKRDGPHAGISPWCPAVVG